MAMAIGDLFAVFSFYTNTEPTNIDVRIGPKPC